MSDLPKFKSWKEFYDHFIREMCQEPVPGWIHPDMLFYVYETYFRDGDGAGDEEEFKKIFREEIKEFRKIDEERQREKVLD